MPVLNNAKNVLLGTQSLSRIKLGATDIWEWSPEALFLSGQQGVWYEPKPEYLFQDAAGTTPVTADGDPVGYMADLSGNGHHATQSTSASRPVYRTDGTLHWLEFDGVDDSLLLASDIKATVSDYSFFVAFSRNAADVTRQEYLFDSSTGRLVVTPYLDGSPESIGYFDGSFKASGVKPDGANVASWILGNSAGYIFINGDEVFQGSYAQKAISDTTRIGTSPGGNNPFGGSLYGFIISDFATGAIERGKAESHLAYLAGVTL